MKKYPYLLYISNNKNISKECLLELHSSAELHILNPTLTNISNINHSNCYFYVFNKEQYCLAKSKHWRYHIALYGEDIFNQDLINLADDNTEIFWFPTHEQILDDIQIFIKRLNIINRAICINFNPYLQKNIIPENFRLFVKEIHQNFINPVFSKEMELLEDNSNISEEYNFLLVEQADELFIKSLVLGLFGDYPVNDMDSFSLINKKKILKTKDCVSCDFNELCINRGIGYIMDQLQYKGCISLKLLQP